MKNTSTYLMSKNGREYTLTMKWTKQESISYCVLPLMTMLGIIYTFMVQVHSLLRSHIQVFFIINEYYPAVH